MTSDRTSTTATATFAGGCFWCTEAVFQALEGVDRVVSGYTGGHVASPSYEDVCQETTGHAEAVRITFDPNVITYRELLEVFFTSHDPTQLNRQGNDVGTQYRSEVFVHDAEQRADAEAVIAALAAEGVFDAPIVTRVSDAGPFYEAEPYHQDFYRSNPEYGYCRVVINPKLAKVRSRFADKLRRTAAD
jgi:peptide-methionine (S)-S-oxide reductase